MTKTIAIFSTKGGVGKTLISSNLAVSLAKSQNKKVCLCDLDLQVVGDMARMLSLNPVRSLADLTQHLKTNPQLVQAGDFLLRADSLGIDFLAGVLKPQQAPRIEPGGIKQAFTLLDKHYDYIIVDAGKSFTDTFLAVLEQANLFLLIVTPDILSVYQTKWALDTLQFLHFPLKMVKIILNRAESISSISWQEVKLNLPVEILAQIPSEGKVVGEALNRGVPVIIDNPRSKISQAIRNLGSALASQEDIFIEHREIDELRLKEAILEEPGDFWLKRGMAGSLADEAEEYEKLDDILILKRRIHSRLIEELNLKRMDPRAFSDAKKGQDLRDKAQMMVTNFLVEEVGSLISSVEVRNKLVKEILDEALGFGPLEDLLADSEITDIMVNNKDEVYIERRGKIELTSKKFISNEQVKTIIERIIAPIGRRIDESIPMVDARLPDGSRVNAIIPPLSLTGPCLTIRKFKKEMLGIEDMVRFDSITSGMAEFLRACVISRKNMIVSGGTGSGKTTMLNIISGFIPVNERIITIEDAAELKLHQEHWVRLESRAANIEGKGAITIKELFRNTLRMRPDRIIIGECRGIETLDMLQAMNTGHDGSMTTIHANSTQDVLARIDSMILMSGVELPIRAIREMIASSIDIIVHTARLSDGARKVIQISEITGTQGELDINLQDIFVFKQTGIDDRHNVLGHFQATGYIPSFVEEIKIKGIPLPQNLFTP